MADKLRVGEFRILENRNQFIPAKMAGEVLFADFREEIASHFVAMVGTGCSQGSLLEQDFFSESIVEGKEKAGPFLGAQALEGID